MSEHCPRRGKRDGEADQVDKYAVCETPDRGALDATQREQIVGDDQQDETQHDEALAEDSAVEERDGEPGQRCAHEGDGGYDDESLMRRGMSPQTICEEDQRREQEEVAHREHVAGDCEWAMKIEVMSELRGRGEGSDEEHQNRENEAGEPESPVQLDVAFDDQAYLHEQEDDPRRKERAMQVDDGTLEGSIDHAVAEIAGPETNQDRHEHENGHAGEEEAIKFASGEMLRGLRKGGRSRQSVVS